MPILMILRGVVAAAIVMAATTAFQSPAPQTAEAWMTEASARAARGDTAGALSAYEEALRRWREQPGQAEAQARTIFQIASLHVRRSEESEALARLEEGRRLAAGQVPNSVVHAQILRGLGYLADLREQYDEAQARYVDALDLLARVAPDDLEVARVLVRLGAIHDRRTNPDEATRAFERALELGRRHGDVSVEGASLNNLGMVSRNRGHLQEAETYFRASLALAERDGPDSMDVALRLGNLGVVADLRGDIDAAEALQTRALAIREQRDPGGRSVFLSRTDLGVLAARRGRHAVAEDHLRAALAIVERLAPDGISHADALANLALVRQERPGGLDEARALHRRALALRERLAPGSLDVARSYSAHAGLDERDGRLDDAADYHRRALEIRARLAPGSHDEALSLHALGQLARQRGQNAAALDWFRRAIAAFEGQSDRLGGSLEVQTGFRAGWGPIYADPIALLAAGGDADAALVLLERARARAVVNLITQRGSAREAGVPPSLAQARRALDAEFGRTQAALARAGASDPAAADRLLATLRDLRARQHALALEIRQAAPVAGSLQYPAAVTPRSIRAMLRPREVAIAYSVGPQATIVFAVTPDEVRAVRIEAGADHLRDAVDRWARLVSRGRIDPQDRTAVIEAGADLYRRLVAPVETALAGATRLLVVPDGPLQRLSFAALVAPASEDAAHGPYLAERLAISTVASFGMLQTLGQRAPAGATIGPEVLVIAAPERAGAPLPGAVREADVVTRAFAGRGRALVGAQANEAEARRWMPSAGVIHVAAHGQLNDHLPLNSALLLSPPTEGPTGDNGQLQAWEVMDQLELAADLVVLSACESSSASSDRAEGMLGLAGAFLFAGARQVVASLWAVADAAAPDVMAEFYAGVRRGASAADALAAAQRRAIAQPATSHPFFWAPFVATGVSR